MSQGKSYRLYHVSPGLTQYTNPQTGEDYNVLVKKETLDEMNRSFQPIPVFNQHKSVEADEAFDFKNGAAENLAEGTVYEVGYDESSGMFYADAVIWDKETQDLIEKGYGVSNSYTAEEVAPGGLYNNVPYDEEVTKGTYRHIAIVSNPRYSGTRIMQNSESKKGGLIMNFKLLFSKKTAATPKENAKKENEVEDVEKKDTMEVDAASTVEVDGNTIPLADMVSAYKAKNQATEVPSLSMTDTVTVDDKEVPVKDLYDAYQATQTGPMVNTTAENSKDSQTATTETKTVENTKATKTDSAVEPKTDESGQDPQKAAPNDHFKVVKNAAQKAPEETKKVHNTPLNRQRHGKKLYGTIKEKE